VGAAALSWAARGRQGQRHSAGAQAHASSPTPPRNPTHSCAHVCCSRFRTWGLPSVSSSGTTDFTSRLRFCTPTRTWTGSYGQGQPAGGPRLPGGAVVQAVRTYACMRPCVQQPGAAGPPWPASSSGASCSRPWSLPVRVLEPTK